MILSLCILESLPLCVFHVKKLCTSQMRKVFFHIFFSRFYRLGSFSSVIHLKLGFAYWVRQVSGIIYFSRRMLRCYTVICWKEFSSPTELSQHFDKNSHAFLCNTFYFFCLHVCVCLRSCMCACMLMPVEVKAWSHVPWRRNYRWLSAACPGCWEWHLLLCKRNKLLLMCLVS